MQENLIFFGLAEAPHGVKEKTEAELRDFLTTELEDPANKMPDIVFDRVHRIGRPDFDYLTGRKKSRPVVAKFEKYSDREYIRKTGIELNKQQRREQFPPEIEERRKTLYLVMRNLAKNEENRVTLARDKLYDNGKLFNSDSDTNNTKQTQPGQTHIQNDCRYVRPRYTRLLPLPPPPYLNNSGGSMSMTNNRIQPLANFSDTPVITSGKKKKRLLRSRMNKKL